MYCINKDSLPLMTDRKKTNKESGKKKRKIQETITENGCFCIIKTSPSTTWFWMMLSYFKMRGSLRPQTILKSDF